MSYQQYPPYGQQAPQGYYNQQQQYPPPHQGQPPAQGYYAPQGQYPPPQQYQQQPQQGQYPPQHQGYYQPPPPGQHYQPPQSSYGQHPPSQLYQHSSPQPVYQHPSPQPGYQHPPPVQPPYGQPSPQQQPPYGQPSPQQQPPYGQPSQQQQHQYGAPPQAYSSTPVLPTPPSLGYGAPQIIPWDPVPDASALRSAMKGFGTDEKTLIRVLTRLDPLQIHAVREAFSREHKGRDLVKDLKSETSGWFEKGLVWIAVGPLEHDCMMLWEATDGPGTKEKVLNDVLLGRSNADMAAIKSRFRQMYGSTLEEKVRGDLSFKTERHFQMVMAGNRSEDASPVVPQEIDRDVTEIYKATEGKTGTDELLVCDILTHRNDAQIRTIAHQYKQKFNISLESVIKKEFSGHMEDALLFQLRNACDPHMHKAMLLEEAMSGVGTRDMLLVSRIVRYHWRRDNIPQIKAAYLKWRGKTLADRIKSETSSHYERLMIACLGE